MSRTIPTVKLVHHDFHDPIYTPEEIIGFKTEFVRIQKNIQILEDQLTQERAKLTGLEHLLK